MSSGVEYHRRRAAAELKRAEQASDPTTESLHRELARLHLLYADGGGETPDAGLGLASLDGVVTRS